MRPLILISALGLAACSNDVDPRVIAGGGIGDGDIDGKLNVYVIDNFTDQPIANATVDVGPKEATTDAKGLVVFEDLSGAQTIAVKAAGYRSAAWLGANGANVTIPLTASRATPDQATLGGTITGWEQLTVPTGHLKLAVVFFSQTDDLGDDANNLKTPNNGNICGLAGTTCNWTLVSRTGMVTLVAGILDRDLKGTPADPNDDTSTVIGWATKPAITVEKGVSQSGLVLTQVEAGNLENVTVDLGSPPAGLPKTVGYVGIEITKDEVAQLPIPLDTTTPSLLAPKPTVFDPHATFRLTGIAQTTSADAGAQSVTLLRGQTTTTLVADTWLEPPTGVTATRTTASFDKVASAKVYSVQWSDSTGPLLEITQFDNTKTSVEVPALVALPTSGMLTVRIQGIGADLDVHDFSLDDDKSLIWGIAAEPVTVQ